MAKNVYFGAGGNHQVKAITFRAGSNRKVIRGWIGVGGANRLFFDDSLEVGHYWLIDASGTKEYKSDGTLVSSNNNSTTFQVDVTLQCSIEMHGPGGAGGDAMFDYSTWMSFGTTYYDSSSAGGGGGGGSGVLFENVTLAPAIYDIIIGTTSNNQATKIIQNNTDLYVCNRGMHGGSGSASYSTAYAGSGGQYAQFTPSTGTNLASAGRNGQSDEASATFGIGAEECNGGVGGSGGSTIGNYGTGGTGARSVAGQRRVTRCYDYGVNGAIIIRKL